MSFPQLRSQFKNYPTAPLVSTQAASGITSSQADGNGTVLSDGGSVITERGFVWSTSANPTTADSKVTVAGTTGAYAGAMTGLSSSTTYHFRAYAINALGTTYGADTTFDTTAGGGGGTTYPGNVSSPGGGYY